jgi:serine/threonine-protein kinase
MPPEVARGEFAAHPGADVYSTGASLFEALAGRRAFVAPNYDALIAATRADDVPDVRTCRPSVPADLATTITRALSDDPSSRFASAHEMLFALLSHRSSEADDWDVPTATWSRAPQPNLVAQCARRGG